MQNEVIPGMGQPRDTVTPNQTRITVPPRGPSVRVQDMTYRGGGTLEALGRLAAQAQKKAAPAGAALPKKTQAPPPDAVRPQRAAAAPQACVSRMAPEDFDAAAVSAPPKAPVPPAETEHVSPPEKAVPKREPEPEPLLPEGPAWRVAGEVLNTYIIVEQGDTVFFIDKHAAHERMNFDRMKAEGYDPMAQTLLTPVVCRLAAEEREALLARRELLEEFGFEVDELGSGLAVRQAPFDIDAADIPAALEEIARKLLTHGSADPAAARDDLLHTMACKAAIKGGWHSAPQELERVARAVMSGQVRYCPHGRPVAIQLTKKELEKQFKRA